MQRANYSKGKLIAVIQTFCNEHQRLPKIHDLAQYKWFIQTRLGGLKNAISLAECEHYEEIELANQRATYIKAIQQFKETHGKQPQFKDFSNSNEIRKLFGNFSTALEAANLKSPYLAPVPRHELIQIIHNFVAQHNRAPLSYEIPNCNVFLKEFGTWAKVIQAAQIPVTSTKVSNKPTNSELLEPLKYFYKLYGRNPEKADIANAQQIVSRFRSWPIALFLAGLPTIDKNAPIRKEIIIQIQSFISEYGRNPLIREVPNHSQIRYLFGSWSNALLAASTI